MKWHIDTAERRAYDAEGILMPQIWPHFPLLPVKRSGFGMPLETGILLAGERPFRVYRANLHLLKSGPPQPQLVATGVHGEYASIEAMQEDGWRVD